MLTEEELRNIIARVVVEGSSIEGLASIILYGSYARGNHHRKSDIDLLLVFRDDESLEKAEQKIPTLYGVSEATLSIETLTLTKLDEYVKSNPYYFKNVLREGLVLFASPPFQIKLREALDGWLRVLLTYDMSRLPNHAKKRIDRILYGVRYRGKWVCKGIINEESRVGRCTLLLTPEKAEEVKKILEMHGATCKERTILQIEP